MPNVKNLKIQLQSGADNSYFASWEFNATTTSTTTTSSAIKKGSLVTIKSTATKWYNGASISDWVRSYQWYVVQSDSNGRIVLGQNKEKTNNIQSAIKSSDVTLVSGGSTSTSTSSSSVDTSTLDHYEVKWYYDSGNNRWFAGSTEETKETYAFYSPPENALKFKVVVKPVSKTYKVKSGDSEVEKSYWTGTSVSTYVDMSTAPPDIPGTPTVTLEDYSVTLSLDNISDPRADIIQFELSTDSTIGVKRHNADVKAARASWKTSLSPGTSYRVRCRAGNKVSTKTLYSEYTDFVVVGSTMPNAPTVAPTCKASSETSVYLSWTAVKSATSYDIEYATKSSYFDATDQTTTVSDITLTYRELIGLESGQTYFFRLRAKNDSGTSGWSPISSVVIGETPAAPTTWSSSSSVTTGTDVILYWVHNSRDNSSQTYAEIELFVNGKQVVIPTIKNTTDEDEKDKTSFYTLSTSSYVEGTNMQWRVRTAGITNKFGEWSVQRTIEVNAPPTLETQLIDADGNSLSTITSFPFYFKAVAGPATQMPLSYHVSVISNEGYETVDEAGNVKMVSSGDEIYSKHFDTSDVLMVQFLPNNIDFVNGKNYTLTCTVAMNSGLTAEESLTFDISWVDVELEPRLVVDIDHESYYAFLHPYCLPSGGEEESYDLVEGVTLAVYRREYDGRFTEIASGLDNSRYTTVIDPHPALDYARYRVVATVNETGAISYYDAPSVYVGGKSIVIQWDEQWSNYDEIIDEVMEEKPWSTSIIKLPYDISVSNKYDKDVELIEYVGRTAPVTYYGTHLGETGNWTTVVPKKDREMIYALRRLSRWMGDVYVREPSGVGYWATISVNFTEKYNDPKVPVTLDVTRVEGGI